MYSGALFIQQSVGWNLYVSIFGLLALTGVCTLTGTNLKKKWVYPRRSYSKFMTSSKLGDKIPISILYVKRILVGIP